MTQTIGASYQQLYYPKRTPQQTLGIVLIVLGAVLLLAYGLGLIFLVPGIILWYYGRERCPYCKLRGTIRPGRSEIIAQDRGFGIVTRTDTVTGRVGRERQRSRVQRQERVPVVRTTTRVAYQCIACRQFVGSKNYNSESEDFSPPQQQTIVQREVQREVLKVPYKYCRTLIDPIREKRCPNCGAVVTT